MIQILPKAVHEVPGWQALPELRLVRLSGRRTSDISWRILTRIYRHFLVGSSNSSQSRELQWRGGYLVACCSDFVISFHNLSTNQMYMEYLIYLPAKLEKWGHSIIFDLQYNLVILVIFDNVLISEKWVVLNFILFLEKKHAGVYEKRYSMESFVSVILRMFVYFHYDNQQICSHFLPFPIIPGSQYRWNKTWKKFI